MSRTKRKEKKKCTEIRKQLKGKDVNHPEILAEDAFIKKQNRKYKAAKQQPAESKLTDKEKE